MTTDVFGDSRWLQVCSATLWWLLVCVSATLWTEFSNYLLHLCNKAELMHYFKLDGHRGQSSGNLKLLGAWELLFTLKDLRWQLEPGSEVATQPSDRAGIFDGR